MKWSHTRVRLYLLEVRLRKKKRKVFWSEKAGMDLRVLDANRDAVRIKSTQALPRELYIFLIKLRCGLLDFF